MSAQPEELEQRLQLSPFCDVCVAPVSKTAHHNFNGYDLLCEKCFCHAFGVEGLLDRFHRCRCNKPYRRFALKIIDGAFRPLCDCEKSSKGRDSNGDRSMLDSSSGSELSRSSSFSSFSEDGNESGDSYQPPSQHRPPKIEAGKPTLAGVVMEPITVAKSKPKVAPKPIAKPNLGQPETLKAQQEAEAVRVKVCLV